MTRPAFCPAQAASDMDDAEKAFEAICKMEEAFNPPKQIVVVPQELMGADQDRYDLVFGEGSLVISEGDFARLEDECRKNFMGVQIDPSAAPPNDGGGLTEFHGLPVKFIRGVPSDAEESEEHE